MDPFRMIKLGAQYEVLSQIESMFSRTSKHKVALHVDKKMREILRDIEIENQKSTKNGRNSR
jgi:hypothetical protein